MLMAVRLAVLEPSMHIASIVLMPDTPDTYSFVRPMLHEPTSHRTTKFMLLFNGRHTETRFRSSTPSGTSPTRTQLGQVTWTT